MTKPLIGVIPDFNAGSKTSYSERPHFAIRQNYIDMIAKAGATPIIIPYVEDSIKAYINMIDGLLVVGGFFDIDPKRYNEEIINDTVILNKTRENFEFNFTENFLATNKPILGICNGMQVINTIKGGSLIQDIPTQNPNCMIHEQSKIKGKEDSSIAYHKVNIEDGTLLQKITNSKVIDTNSSHHQAIKTPGNNLTINAKAKDGIIEGIEDPTHNFCLGIQWHPEFDVSFADQQIFKAFIESC